MPPIEYLKTIDSPTLANAIERLQVRPNERGFTPLEIRCFFPELGRMCGYAVTAQVETVTQMEPFRLESFIELYRLVEQSPKPAVIVLQEIGGFPDYAAHCGEVMASFFTRLGAAGLVSDCGVRDLPEVRRLGFHYFARGSVASHANYRIARTGVPVQVRGMVVRPGDLIHADENGVITVPPVDLERLREAVDTVRRREKTIMDFVRGEAFRLDNFRDLVVE
ncbi:MAG TPA: RraA family protein [Bryobacteraceae bacterium]|jgi:regulator of RNase E activity RraA|nr:RraA family protein [Bryobacteraceae bacterium]